LPLEDQQLGPRLTFAECVTMRICLTADQAAVVFSGTVVKVAANTASAWGGHIVTFDVDRVWKGAPTKQFVIYSFSHTPDRFEFTVGEKADLGPGKPPLP
jgi:hypothetical protein